ncbi:MAG: hypothetical protein ACRCYU_19205, partial [Nocardioides sp.]
FGAPASVRELVKVLNELIGGLRLAVDPTETEIRLSSGPDQLGSPSDSPSDSPNESPDDQGPAWQLVAALAYAHGWTVARWAGETGSDYGCELRLVRRSP